jgi:hypothetical protein
VELVAIVAQLFALATMALSLVTGESADAGGRPAWLEAGIGLPADMRTKPPRASHHHRGLPGPN